MRRRRSYSTKWTSSAPASSISGRFPSFRLPNGSTRTTCSWAPRTARSSTLNPTTDKLGGLTYNVTTPYALPFIDLAKEGPFVAEMPAGEIRGAAHDAWQIGITQITEPGKYLFVGPGQDVPAGAEEEGFKIHQSPTNNLLLGIRLMPASSAERLALLEQVSNLSLL